METLLILTNLPDAASADSLARQLVESGHAACVNVLPACRSIYRWQGEVEVAEDVPLLIKSTAGAYAALEEVIRKQHPYELPEIIAVPIVRGLSGYLAWVETETTPSGKGLATEC